MEKIVLIVCRDGQRFDGTNVNNLGHAGIMPDRQKAHYVRRSRQAMWTGVRMPMATMVAIG